MPETLYQVLGVKPGNTREEIRDAYWELARTNHPDVAGYENTARFTCLVVAYHALSDKQRREDYDKRLALSMTKCAKCEGTGTQYRPPTNRPCTCNSCHGVGYKEKK